MSLTFSFQRAIITLLLVLGSMSSYAQTCNNRVRQTTPNSDYVISDDGAEVAVEKTRLIWQRCSVGQRWDGSSCSGVAVTYTWAGALTLVDEQWRLPNIKELMSLVEAACESPSINASVFPNTLSGDYWSSSSAANAGDLQSAYNTMAWGAYFINGTSYMSEKSTGQYVRLVRGGQ